MAATEVRIKLHMTSPIQSNVKNMWMCLNYDQKPTVGHIIDHIKENFCTDFSTTASEYDNPISAYYNSNKSKLHDLQYVSVKLFLDDFWLPPCENSRLIRESDCIKVHIVNNLLNNKRQNINNMNANINTNNPTLATNQKKLELEDDFFHYNEQNKKYQASRQQYESYKEKFENMKNNYNNYYTENNNYDDGDQQQQNAYGEDFDYDEYYPHGYDTIHTTKAKTTTTMAKPTEKAVKSAVPSKPTTTGEKAEKKSSSENKTKKTTGQQQNCYKKFAVGSLINYLKEEANNDNNDVEQQKPKESANKKKTKNTGSSGKAEFNSAVDKIASKLKMSGAAKYNNATSKKSTHIIFSSSGSDSSSDEEKEKEEEHFETNKVAKTVVSNTKKHQQSNTDANANTNTKSKYYEPTKEEQLNAANYNRTFTIENPKTLREFKNVFNASKLNAPTAEEMAAVTELANCLSSLDTSSMSTSSNGSSSSNSSSMSTSTSNSSSLSESAAEVEKKRKKSKKISKLPKVDYSKLDSLVGSPRIGDKLAFQVLEISSNFTPEVSKYKTGEVVEFDSQTNEITLKLESARYNAVLQRANKFSVVFDENEEQEKKIKESILNQEKHTEENEAVLLKKTDEMLKIDWRNLINVKMMLKESMPVFGTLKTDEEKVTAPNAPMVHV